MFKLRRRPRCGYCRGRHELEDCVEYLSFQVLFGGTVTDADREASAADNHSWPGTRSARWDGIAGWMKRR